MQSRNHWWDNIWGNVAHVSGGQFMQVLLVGWGREQMALVFRAPKGFEFEILPVIPVKQRRTISCLMAIEVIMGRSFSISTSSSPLYAFDKLHYQKH